MKRQIVITSFLIGLVFCQAAWAQLTSLPLSLEDVLLQVQKNHPKLRGAELERRMASAKLLEKQGAFDPAITFENDTQRYNSYPKRGQEKFENLNDVSIGVLTRYGAKISATSNFHYGDVKSPASGTGNTGSHFLGLHLPLLRGARINEKSASEQRAIIGEPLANAEYNQFRLTLLLKASDNYWNWVASKQKADINQGLLRLAQIRARQIQERAKSGDLPVIDSVEANQEVQRRQEALFKSQREFQKSSISIANYLWDNTSSQLIRPVAEQAPDTMSQPKDLKEDEIQEAKMLALKNRPELAQLELLKDMTDIDLDLARNQLLPIVDLYAGPGIDTGAGSIGPLFKAGISVAVPLRNRTARGQVEQAKLKLQKLDLYQKALLQQVLLEVEDTASELKMTYQRYESAREAYQLAKQLEEGERTRFELGDSTLFLVNQRERSTAEAFIKMVEIQAEYQQAAIRMVAVTGQL
ncbi:MAG: TolC family protein [Vampirovibrionales bacterium]|nr:TolC family protein [Vampirovibrionales bacterium]